jgi:hypothetical protein
MIAKGYKYNPLTGAIYLNGKQTFKAVKSSGYLHGRFNGVFKSAHQVAWFLSKGKWPSCIDHINGDKQDNRIDNLREVPQSTNVMNSAMRKDNTSGHTGVWQAPSGRWRARITTKGVVVNLGLHDNMEDALLARQVAKEKYGFTDRHGK